MIEAVNNLYKLLLRNCFLFFYFTTCLFVFGQQDSATSTITLAPVILESTKLNTPRKTLSQALTIYDFGDRQRYHQQLSLQEYLRQVPGLFTLNANNYAQDLRLSIRGFGSRAAFGIRGVKLVVDGIPETTPDGQGQLDNLPLGLIQSLTVLRGPASSFYGNAAGGVIQINTLSDFEDDFVRFRTQGGSFSSSNLSATVGLKNNKTKAIFYQNLSQSDGYRDHSKYKQQVFNTRIWHDFSSKSKLSFQFNYTNSPYAYDAGGINLQSAIENRRQARPQNKSFQTFESIEHIKTGLQWEKNFGKNLSFSSYLFYAYRDFKGRLPFEFGGLVDLARDYYGGGVVVEYKPKEYHNIQFRVSFADQTDHRKRFKNIAGEAGDITLDQKELFDNKSISLLDEYRLSFGVLRAGLRFDRQQLGTNVVDRKTNLNVVNYSLGFTYTDLVDHIFFASFATSFETPTLSELSANPFGEEGFNPDLSSAQARNFELGWRYNSFFGQLETTLYFIKTKNELISYELEDFPTRTLYRNAGRTNRKGIEVQWELRKKAWHWLVAFNYGAIEFDNYQLEDKNLSGNKLPGIPQQQFFASSSYNFSNGWGIMSLNQYCGSIYSDDSNQNKISPYFLSNLKAWKSLNDFEFFAGINNLFDRKYNDNIRINAWGKRYYEPAPMRNFYFGVSFTL